MDSITVNTDEIRTIASNVDKYAKQYEAKYQELLNEVKDFTSTDFTGEDADAFRNQVEGFRDDFVAMKDLMNQYANYLREAAQNYDDTRAKIKTQAGTLQN